ncbi:MAG: flagellar hook-basal body complex protein FliE [Acidobacteria bacterium]|jgi:flagellar hook-basal body complex protein FliE|nr:flagellar hook-basal body complex protein FliE [Acidobacteriota bacterium]
MAIAPIGTPVTAVTLPSTPRIQGAESPGFSDTLKQLVDKVETSGTEANDAIGRMMDGTGDVHEAMIALQTSDLAFQMAVQVRNKFVQAYQDIMRMPV